MMRQGVHEEKYTSSLGNCGVKDDILHTWHDTVASSARSDSNVNIDVCGF